LVPVEGARRMASALREGSTRPVVFAELPFAQHAFDLTGSVRARHTVCAVERFLAYVRAAATPVPLPEPAVVPGPGQAPPPT
ncbi:MAG TPA: hypothetical protein VE152_01085, partial [Acidimicrobiales bacterium]|nr:hypothetical protein [Acidimicrobiales bacterium]